MTSKQRVNAALNHKDADRVPISLGSSIVDGFTLYAKDNYEKYLGHELSIPIITHKPMGTVVTPEKIYALSQSDFRTVRLKAPWNNPVTEYADGSYLDDFGVRMKPCRYYYDAVTRPLAGDITKKDILNCAWPDPYAPGRADGLREEASTLAEDTDYAVVADIMCGGPFEQSLWLRGWEDFLSDLYTEPALAEALMDRITELDIQLWGVFLEAAGDYVDVACQGDDLAMQDRPVVSPEMYNKYIKKYHKRIYDFIKSKTKAKIFHHCCGSVYSLIPGLLEAGIDILNPVQTSAKNMEPEKLKSEFGNDLVFWGGLDTQKILPYGSPSDVEAEVNRLMETLGRGGGYVFAPGHNIQDLVPPDNIDAMLRSAGKYRTLK